MQLEGSPARAHIAVDASQARAIHLQLQSAHKNACCARETCTKCIHTHAIRILYAHKRAEMNLSCIFVRNKVQPYARDKVEKRSNARTSTLALPASPASICGITSHHHQPASRASSTQHHQPKLIESEIIKSHKSGALRSSVICAQTTQQPKNAPHPQTPSFGGLSCENTGESTVVHFPTTNFERSAKRPNVSYNLSWSPNKPANNCPFSLSQGTSFGGGLLVKDPLGCDRGSCLHRCFL